MWSAFVLFLGPKYGFDAGQKFLLTTVPTAVGAVLLFIPCIATSMVLEPGVSFNTLLAVAALAGIGGGNFSSSMANIDSCYPQRLKGWALGLNAGGGPSAVASPIASAVRG